MDNEVVIHVRVDNDTAAGFGKARAGAGKTASDIEGDFSKAFARAAKNVFADTSKMATGVEGEFAKTSKAIAKESDKAAKSVEGEFAKVSKTIGDTGTKTGTEFSRKIIEGLGPGLHATVSDTRAQISGLDQEINKHRQSLGALAAAYASTTDVAHRMDLGKAFRDAETEIRKLTKNKSILEKLLPTPQEAASAGRVVATEVGGSMSKAFSGMGSMLAPVLAGVGIAAAPLIGGAIAGAVIGGVGIGGVLGGVMLAVRNPAVTAAGKQLGEGLLKDLGVRAAVFIQPILHGIDMIKSSFGAMGADFSRIFNSSSKFLGPLINGVTSMIQKIVHGMANLTEIAGPVIDSISEGFSGIGGAIEDMFNDLKDNGVDAAVALDVVFKGLELTIRLVGGAINILVESFGFLAKFGAFGQDAAIQYARLENNAKLAAAANQGAATSFGLLGGSADAAAGPVASLGDKLDSIYNTERKLFDANTDTGAAFDRLSESIKKNGKSLDVHTEKGRANRTALSGLVSALNAQYKAYEEANGAGADATRVANSNYASFIRAARGLGLSEKAAKDYAHQLGLLPPTKTTSIYANTHDAEARLEAMREHLAAIHGKTISVHVVSNIVSVAGQIGKLAGYGKASGGIVGAAANGSTSNGLTWTGEHGPELLDLPPGTRVHSNPDSMRMAAQAGGRGQGVELIVRSGGTKMDDLLVEILRTAVRVKGAGSVQTLLGVRGVAA
jgi:hypothetical protein